ncbi:MAG: hypothetical protein ABH952_12460 [Candidatus Omnitrophota bacterium]
MKIIYFSVLITVLLCLIQQPADAGFKQTVIKKYAAIYTQFKHTVLEGKLRRGSLEFSFYKDISFLRYYPCQVIAILKNVLDDNFYPSLGCIFVLVIIFFIFGLPTYYQKIPVIFIPLLGFINVVFIFVFSLFLKIRYYFFTYFMIVCGISFLIIAIRLLVNRNSYKCIVTEKDRMETFYMPLYLFFIGLFLILGHLGHLDIPRSYDHMTYSTYAALLKIEGTYPLFNIYRFPSLLHSYIPSGYIVILSFISDLLHIPIASTQLILGMLFFPFLGIGVYYICGYIFEEKKWCFIAGVLALALRMSAYIPVDGQIVEVLEWVLVAFALFTLFSYFDKRDKNYLFFTIISLYISFMLHIKLAVYTFGGLFFSLLFMQLKFKAKDIFSTFLAYLVVAGAVFTLALPYFFSINQVATSSLFGSVNLSLLEFFENMIFRHGYILLMFIIIGIPIYIRSKNKVIVFAFAYLLMFFLYFDQWILWESIRPAWYSKIFTPGVSFFGSIGTYTSVFCFISTYSQIASGFNIVLPILFVYTIFRIVPKKYFKIVAIFFALFLLYESGIRPEVPPQLISRADFKAANWIRENTDKGNAFVANIGDNAWNIACIAERKCLKYRAVCVTYSDDAGDPLQEIDFQNLLLEDFDNAIELLKQFRFTHLMVSDRSELKDADFSNKKFLNKVFQFDIDNTKSVVYEII